MTKTILSIITTLAISSTLLFSGGDIDTPDKTIPEVVSAKKIPTSHTLKRVYVDYYADLMWEDEEYTLKERSIYRSRNNGFPFSSNFSKIGNFDYAKKYCSNLNYASFSDWRLPKKEELQQQLQDTDRTQNFYYKTVGYFWSSNTEDEGISIYTESGYAFPERNSKNMYIRCVREMNKKDPQN